MKKRILAILLVLALAVCAVPAAASAEATTATGNNREAVIYQYLTETMGLNQAAACGVLGNLDIETGATFDPTIWGGSAYGICQWMSYRRDNLRARSDGDTLAGQLDYIRYELLGGDCYGRQTYDYLLSVENTADGAYNAAWYFAKYFERCASYTYSLREGRAVNRYWPVYSRDAFRSTTAALTDITAVMGESNSLTGTVTFSMNITSVRASVLNSSGTAVLSASAAPNTLVYDLSDISGRLNFASLPAGRYTVEVVCTAAGVDYTVFSCGMKVVDLAKVNGGCGFWDIDPSDYFYTAVIWAKDEQISSGVAKGRFGPYSSVSRAQAVTFLWRMAGSPEPTIRKSPFTDVTDSGAYYYKAVLWAYENGIAVGDNAGRFCPGDEITRGQMITFLWRYAGSPKVTGSMPYADVEKSDYYYMSILWCTKTGIASGITSTQFSPDIGCTRGQGVTFLYRENNLSK